MFEILGKMKNILGLTLVLSALIFTVGAHAAASFKVLESFANCNPDCPEGAYPYAGLVRDSAGNLYGTATEGGPFVDNLGVVFKLSGRTETILYSFCSQANCTDGAMPESSLIMDSSGNLYGTTYLGGTGSSCDGCGTVFRLAPDGTETVLYSFSGGSDGGYPKSGLTMDKAGNLYGTTYLGGSGCGTVFKLSPDGTETVLHTFEGSSDGCYPFAGVIADKYGNLYGTTFQGGGTSCNDGAAGCGIIFKIAPDGSETVIHAFTGGSDGAGPSADFISDKSGNLYSTTWAGGNEGLGVVFKLGPDGTETVLYTFLGGSDGAAPGAGLVRDKSGNMYGTTVYGGSQNCDVFGCGTVYELAPDGTEKLLHVFAREHDGANPQSVLISDKKGYLYGTTENGRSEYGQGGGTVFKLKP